MKLDQVIAKRSNKTIYRDGDKTVKVFEPTFSTADVLNEALNLARVGETDLHIPKLHEVTKIDDKWAIVYDYVDGTSLSDLMQAHPEKNEEYLKLFVELQMEIHRQSVPLLTKLRDKMHRKIDQTELDATARYELHTRLEGMPRHNKLCHGDYNPGNIILTGDGTPYILDWSHATQGNASADVARTYLLYILKGQKEEAERYLNLFCRQSDTAKQYVQKWLPIVAASQSVKGRKEEREILLSWANVVEFE
jgi:serine/threonine protein kinase